MKRNIYSKLVQWRNSPNRKPLIIQGARQVGKTFLMQSFARKEFANYLYINFEEDVKIRALFDDNLDPQKIITSQKFTLKKSSI